MERSVESSSVLFLRNREGKTLRALIPSQGAAREMLAYAIAAWAVDAGYDGYHSYCTHAGYALHNFAMADGWAEGLAHAQTIDAVDSACEQPIDERPVVRIAGKLIQEGVALATGLEVNGVLCVLLPTRFFAQLAADVGHAGRLITDQHLVPAI